MPRPSGTPALIGRGDIVYAAYGGDPFVVGQDRPIAPFFDPSRTQSEAVIAQIEAIRVRNRANTAKLMPRPRTVMIRTTIHDFAAVVTPNSSGARTRSIAA